MHAACGMQNADEMDRAGYDIRSLSRFLAAQKTGFHKLLKKYKKWTGSEHLTNRFSGKLENRSSFYQPDFERASSEHSELQGTVQAALASVSQTLDDVPGPPSPDSLSPQYRSRTHSRRHSRRSTLHGDSSAHSSTESTLAGLTDGATYNETSHSSAPASDAGSTQPRRKKIMQQYKRNTRIETINGERYWNELAGDDEDNREAPYTILVAPSHHGSGSEDEDRTLSSYVSHGITKTLRRMRHPLKRKVPIKISESTPLLDDGLETSAETSSDEDMPRKLKSVNGQHYRKTYDLEQNFQNEHKYGYRHLYFMLASLALVILTGSLALHESLKRRRNPEKHAGRRLATDMGAVTGSMVSLMSGIVGITMFLMGGGRAGWIHITTVWLMFGLVCVGAGAVMALVGRTESGG